MDNTWDGHIYFTVKTSQVYAVDCSGFAELSPDGYICPWETLENYDANHGTHWYDFAQELYPAIEGEWARNKHIIRLTDESDIPDTDERRYYEYLMAEE